MFARELATIHRPIAINWPAKFGLSEIQKTNQPSQDVKNYNQPINLEQVVADSTVEITTDKPKQKLIFHLCNEAVPCTVAKFCWFNKPKSGENLYCIECQKKVLS